MFLVLVLTVFAGVCSWLISKQNDLSRMARLSLLVNPMLLILALIAFSYSVMLKGFYSGMYHEFFKNLKTAAIQSDPADREKTATIIADESTAIEERLNALILHLESNVKKQVNPGKWAEKENPSPQNTEQTQGNTL